MRRPDRPDVSQSPFPDFFIGTARGPLKSALGIESMHGLVFRGRSKNSPQPQSPALPSQLAKIGQKRILDLPAHDAAAHQQRINFYRVLTLAKDRDTHKAQIAVAIFDSHPSNVGVGRGGQSPHLIEGMTARGQIPLIRFTDELMNSFELSLACPSHSS
jgi:hypothetical protein